MSDANLNTSFSNHNGQTVYWRDENEQLFSGKVCGNGVDENGEATFTIELTDKESTLEVRQNQVYLKSLLDARGLNPETTVRYQETRILAAA